MREILFRGKRVIDGKWVESCCPLGEMHSGTVTYDFVSKTVCQYTGLTDKNGRKIFENDILEFTTSDDCKSNYIIFWNEVEWSIRETKLDAIDDCRYWNPDEWEVVGNIFDNPELIEKEMPESWKENLMSKFSEVN